MVDPVTETLVIYSTFILTMSGWLIFQTMSDCILEGDSLHQVVTRTSEANVFAYEGQFSIDGVEAAKWHQLCHYNVTRYSCVKNETLCCYCYHEGSRKVKYILSVPQTRFYSGMTIRWTGGSTYGESYMGQFRNGQVQVDAIVTLWINGRPIIVGDESDCYIEVKVDAFNNLTYCVKYFNPVITTSLSISGLNSKTNTGECLTSTISMSAEAIGHNTTATFRASESSVCKRSVRHVCMFRAISPERLSLGPFNQLHSGSPCEEGVKVGDYFYFKGWVDVKDINLSVRKPRIQIQRYTETGTFATDQTLNLETEGCNDQKKANTAYCYRKQGNKYQIIINRTALFHLNHGRFRLWWPSSPPDGDASRSQAVPIIHKKILATVEVEGKIYNMSKPPELLHLPLVRGKILFFKFCVQNSRGPFFLEMLAEPSKSSGFHSKSCMEVRFRDTCTARSKDFKFLLRQTQGCKKRSQYAFKEMPLLIIDGRYVPTAWESGQCPFQSSDLKDRNARIEVINVAKPYKLMITIDNKPFRSSVNQSVSIRGLNESGTLNLKVTETMCSRWKDYSCVISKSRNMCGSQNPALRRPYLSLRVSTHSGTSASRQFQRPCRLTLKENTQYFLRLCLSNLSPPYNIQITVDNTGATPSKKTSSCATFFHKAKKESFANDYVFKVTDRCNFTKLYKCLTTLDPSPSDLTDIDPDHTDIDLCDSQNPALHPPQLSLTVTTHSGIITSSEFQEPCSLTLEGNIEYYMRLCPSNLQPPYNIQISLNNTLATWSYTTNSCVIFSRVEKEQFFKNEYVFKVTDRCSNTKSYRCLATQVKVPVTKSDTGEELWFLDFLYFVGGIILSLLLLALAILAWYAGRMRNEGKENPVQEEGEEEGGEPTKPEVFEPESEYGDTEIQSSYGTSVDETSSSFSTQFGV